VSGTDPYVIGVARIHKVFASPPGIRQLGELSWEGETVGLGPGKNNSLDQEETRVTKATD